MRNDDGGDDEVMWRVRRCGDDDDDAVLVATQPDWTLRVAPFSAMITVGLRDPFEVTSPMSWTAAGAAMWTATVMWALARAVRPVDLCPSS